MLRFFLGIFLLWEAAFSSTSSLKLADHFHIVVGCSIYQLNGTQIKSYPGRFCLFLNDGSVVSSTATSLRLINPDSTIRWEIPGNYPRHLNLSNDRKRILTFRSFVDKSSKEFWRQDELLVIDLNGKILAQQKISDLVPLKESWHVAMATMDETEARMEKSHFNSIYEVPALKGKHDPKLKEGHIIANSVRLGAFVLTPDLKTITTVFTNKNLKSPLIHDVQVTPEGKILYFNNRLHVPSGLLASGVEIYDPVKDKIVYTFKANPPEIFYSECCGSVQMIDDRHILFAGFQGGGHFLDKKTGKIVKQFTVSFQTNNSGLPNVFLMKVQDLRDFFSMRKD